MTSMEQNKSGVRTICDQHIFVIVVTTVVGLLAMVALRSELVQRQDVAMVFAMLTCVAVVNGVAGTCRILRAWSKVGGAQ